MRARTAHWRKPKREARSACSRSRHVTEIPGFVRRRPVRRVVCKYKAKDGANSISFKYLDGTTAVDLSRSIEHVVGLALLQGTVRIHKLHVDTVVQQPSGLLQVQVFLARELRESPVPRNDHLLPARELELGTPQSLLREVGVDVLAPNRHQNLSDRHTGTQTVRLSERSTHSRLEPISSSARKHLVDTQDVVRVHTHTEVERLLSGLGHHVLVGSNTGSLKGLGGDVLLLPGHQMHTRREDIDTGPLGASVVNPNLRVRHTTAVARLRIRLILNLTVTLERTCGA